MNTTNYTTLSESVTTKKEALAVANATFCPSVLAERSRLLLFDFITRFFNGDKEKQERLINELHIDNGATIKSALIQRIRVHCRDKPNAERVSNVQALGGSSGCR